MASLQSEGNVFVMTIDMKFNFELLESIHKLLDEVENTPGPKALVITGGIPGNFSQGLDMMLFFDHGFDIIRLLFAECSKLWARLLQFGIPTVAAINGACYAAGFMTAMACDYRYLVNDKTIMSMPEIILGLPIPEAGLAVLQAKLDQRVIRELVLNGKAYQGVECLQDKLVDSLVAPRDLISKAVDLAYTLISFGEQPEIYSSLKKALYRPVIGIVEKGEMTEEEVEAATRYFGAESMKRFLKKYNQLAL